MGWEVILTKSEDFTNFGLKYADGKTEFSYDRYRVLT